MTVDVAVRGDRADLTLRRPEVLNAIDVPTFDALGEAADELAAAPGVRVVVVSGAGRAFSSGIDLSALSPPDGDLEAMIARAQAGYRKLAALPMPTVAMVHGYALGAGLQLALACDLRVVAEGTQMGLLEGRYGLIPDLCGSTRLPHLVGPARAKRMIWLAEKIDAHEAEAIGLADWVVPREELDDKVTELAADLAGRSPVTLRESKRLIDESHRRSLTEGMDAEARAQIECMSHESFAETLMAGVRATASR